MDQWLRAAFSGRVVRRGMRYAVVVGIILVAINHGDTLLKGELTSGGWLRIGFTVLVPYCVSVLSSVAALREAAVIGPRDRSVEEVG